ncbi:MAG: flagellar basal body-associated protein FliL [Nitrospiria bacterium]
MADTDEEVQEKKGPGIKLIIIIGVVVGVVVGGAAAFFLKGGSPPENTAAQAEAPSGEEEAAAPPPEAVDDGGAESEGAAEEDVGGIFDLEPFIVNLADTSKVRYLKITIKLELMRAKYAEDLNAHLPQIRDTLLLLLSSKEFASIRTVEGKMELRDEVLQRVNAIFRNSKVKMAYFTDFVTQ